MMAGFRIGVEWTLAVGANQFPGKKFGGRGLPALIAEARGLIDFLYRRPFLRFNDRLMQSLMVNPLRFRFIYLGGVLIGQMTGVIHQEDSCVNRICENMLNAYIAPTVIARRITLAGDTNRRGDREYPHD